MSAYLKTLFSALMVTIFISAIALAYVKTSLPGDYLLHWFVANVFAFTAVILGATAIYFIKWLVNR